MLQLKELEGRINLDKKIRVAVAGAEEKNVLEALKMSYENGTVDPILIGGKNKIEAYAKELSFDISSWKCIDTGDLKSTGDIAAQLVSQGQADCIMKGLTDTSLILKAVLKSEYHLRESGLLCHLALYELPAYKKVLFFADTAMIPSPSYEDKKEIIKNCYTAARNLGYKEFKVACLSVSEKLNSKIVSSSEAYKLKEDWQNGAFEDGIIIEGPISLDLALSESAAAIKKYDSPVAGDADMLLCPNLEMGNGIGKAFSLFGNATYAGVVIGAKAPIILVSRGDKAETKYYSILLAGLLGKMMIGEKSYD